MDTTSIEATVRKEHPIIDDQSAAAGTDAAVVAPAEVAAALTTWFTRFRHVLASGIRGDLPWEDLPMAQVEILRQLVHRPGMRISDIAHQHRLAVNTVSTLVKELQRKGYVTRRPDPRDGRAHLLDATPAGEAALEGWLAINRAFVSTAVERLPPETIEALTAGLPALDDLAGALEDSYHDTFDKSRPASDYWPR